MTSDESSKDVDLFSYLNRLNPASRFASAPETTINRSSDDLKIAPNPAPEPSSTEPNTLTVLNWNIAKNNQSASWAEEFLGIVERYEPDKIFLQEVFLCAERQTLPELAHMGWSFAPNFIDTYHNAYSGVLIATKASLLNSQVLTTDHTEPITNTPKVSLFTEYSLLAHSDNLLAVNTHLINFVELSKFTAQLDALELVLAQHSGPVIFSGDFNTWSQGRWQMLSQMTTRLGLSCVSFHPDDTPKIKSFLRSPPLDYIFYRGFKQKPHSARVIDTVTSSDHNPLLVELCY